MSFAYPQSVAASAEGTTVPAHDGAGGPWWEVAPQHVEIALGGYVLPKTLHEPRVAVYPTAEFAAQSAQAAAQIEGLKQLLQAKPENPEGQLPFLPLINAGQMMHLRVKYLPFKGGEGVSYVTQLAQGLTPINNEELFYTFQGLTADGKYYVSAILPVSNKSLPATANDLPAAQMKAMNANFKAYVNEVTQTLASAEDASFTPALAELDGLVQSIEVKPDAAAQATVVQVEMGRYPDIDPEYSVQQIPAVPPGDNVSWFDAHPPLTLVTLPGYAGGRPARLPYYFSEPTVQVYRVADFAGFGQSSETLSFQGQYEALKKLLDEKAPLTACSGVTLKPGQNQAYPVLPLLPLVNAAQVFCTQPAYVDFEGGKGIRYVTAFSQSPEPVSDLPVFYTFQGLTDDGEHYVLALLPVATGIQPAQAGEGLDANAWTTMLKEWVGKLGALDSSGFRPSLEALDLLVGSIAVR